MPRLRLILVLLSLAGGSPALAGGFAEPVTEPPVVETAIDPQGSGGTAPSAADASAVSTTRAEQEHEKPDLPGGTGLLRLTVPKS